MQIKKYLDDILDKITACPYVEYQNISFEERPPDVLFLTGQIIFIDGSKFNFKEFIIFSPSIIEIVKYGYNYLGKDGALNFRYDNALDPKAKSLLTYPAHKHYFEKILPAERPSFEDVLSEIAGFIEKFELSVRGKGPHHKK